MNLFGLTIKSNVSLGKKKYLNTNSLYDASHQYLIIIFLFAAKFVPSAGR